MSSAVGRHRLDCVWQVLMIAARMTGAPTYLEKIEEMEKELTKVIEDFDRAVNVEVLCLAKKSGKHSQPQSGVSSFLVVSCRAKISA